MPLKKVLYSALINRYDNIHEIPKIDGWDCVMFTSMRVPERKKSNWDIVDIYPTGIKDPALVNRWHKLHPHVLFPDHSMSIYIDANIGINDFSYLEDSINQLVAEGITIAAAEHPFRNCIYEEAIRVEQLGLESQKNIDKTIAKIRSEGFPAHYGLFENNLLFRMHNDLKIIALMDDWWDFLVKYSKRDQLSLSYFLWKHNIESRKLFNRGDSQRNHPSFEYTLKHRGKRTIQQYAKKKLISIQREIKKSVGEKANKYRIRRIFKRKVGYRLNLRNPVTFNEKLNWLKFNYQNDLLSVCADKYAVREYVTEKGFGSILTKLYAVSDSCDEIAWEELPNRFVVKTTHDSGSVWIVKDKQIENYAYIKHVVERALSRSFGRRSYEMHYQKIAPRVVVEELLGGDDSLVDYKFFCFHGVPKYIQVDFDRWTNHTRNFFDLSWKALNFSTEYPVSKETIDRPEWLDHMLKIAGDLSSGLPFVRVDLYYADCEVKFGEMTFFHGGGFERFSDGKWDTILGSHLDISKVV